MRTIARMSVLIGAGLVTGAMLGAGPAQAAPQPHNENQDTVVGYFVSQSDCEWVGRVGDMQNKWDDHSCDRADGHQYRGLWELKVDSSSNDNNNDNYNNGNDNNPWNNNGQNGHNGHGGHGGNSGNNNWPGNGGGGD